MSDDGWRKTEVAEKWGGIIYNKGTTQFNSVY